MNEVRLRNERSVDKEEEESHYNDEGVATNYESAFFYDNLEYRDWCVSSFLAAVTTFSSHATHFWFVTYAGFYQN